MMLTSRERWRMGEWLESKMTSQGGITPRQYMLYTAGDLQHYAASLRSDLWAFKDNSDPKFLEAALRTAEKVAGLAESLNTQIAGDGGSAG